MRIFLWVLQIFLAIVFLLHGFVILFPPAPMAEQLASLPYSVGFIKFIGLAEVLAGLGLTLPAWTGIMPGLVPLAAAGLVPIMAGAIWLHIAQGEIPQTIFTTILVLMAAFVAYMRWRVWPFQVSQPV